MQALEKQAPITDASAEKQLVQLLSTPLDTYNVVIVLELANYPSVMSLLRPAKCKVIQQPPQLADSNSMMFWHLLVKLAMRQASPSIRAMQFAGMKQHTTVYNCCHAPPKQRVLH